MTLSSARTVLNIEFNITFSSNTGDPTQIYGLVYRCYLSHFFVRKDENVDKQANTKGWVCSRMLGCSRNICFFFVQYCVDNFKCRTCKIAFYIRIVGYKMFKNYMSSRGWFFWLFRFILREISLRLTTC